MPLTTTTIGAFPKPAYVEVPDWFAGESMGPETTTATNELAVTPEIENAVARGIREVVATQVAAGVDVPTDGEVRRENYVHYHCRHLDGIDFGVLTPKLARNGSWDARLPTFVGPVAAREPFLDRDFIIAQAATDRPVKITMPGPMTIMDSTADSYYGDEAVWGEALAGALNREARALVAAGCRFVQIDEPVFARYPEKAIAFGFGLLDLVLDGLDGAVTTTLHMCCGYPDRIDNSDYPKADAAAYRRLAESVDASSVDAVSIEDAHRHNDPELFAAFERATVILGAVRIADSRIESADEIAMRVEDVLPHISPQRLQLAPDCGLGMLPQALAVEKLRRIRTAADRF